MEVNEEELLIYSLTYLIIFASVNKQNNSIDKNCIEKQECPKKV